MQEGTLFSVVPQSWCPHLEEHVRPFDSPSNPVWGLDTPCSKCNDSSENWVCLSCYQVHFLITFLWKVVIYNELNCAGGMRSSRVRSYARSSRREWPFAGAEFLWFIRLVLPVWRIHWQRSKNWDLEIVFVALIRWVTMNDWKLIDFCFRVLLDTFPGQEPPSFGQVQCAFASNSGYQPRKMK